jgi:hypothetical protein
VAGQMARSALMFWRSAARIRSKRLKSATLTCRARWQLRS